MSFYRKKPVVIEARLFDPGTASVLATLDVIRWCGGIQVGYSLEIPTLEGLITASPGDYIIKGVKGEFYPCKPDIFAETYEEAVA